MSLGSTGEQYASQFLINHGYKILKKNYRSRFGEIDIVAKENETYVFVEVKTRTNEAFGTPLEAINSWKLRKLIKTSLFYINQFKLGDCDYRFDALEVTVSKGATHINHIKNITQ